MISGLWRIVEVFDQGVVLECAQTLLHMSLSFIHSFYTFRTLSYMYIVLLHLYDVS